jgi:hypothetical protein
MSRYTININANAIKIGHAMLRINTNKTNAIIPKNNDMPKPVESDLLMLSLFDNVPCTA